MMVAELAKGFGIGAALIAAIGPQNMFVINQGIRRRHVFLTALVCSLVDTALILMGIFGVAELLAFHPTWMLAMRCLGAAFLVVYGCYALRGVFRPTVLGDLSDAEASTSKLQTIVILLGLGFLNPHAYLDAVVVIGGLAMQEPKALRDAFTVGVVLASFVWFYALAYGAQLLSPLFQKKIAWRILNAITAVIMFAVAVSLVLGIHKIQ